MSDSSDKIHEILRQIEGNSVNHISDRKKTVDEVVNIFLHDASTEQHAVCQDNGKTLFDMEELRHWKEQMNRTYQISYYHEIICFRKHFRKLIIFAKRLIRKMCGSLMQPIIEELNTFHANTTASVNTLYNNEAVTEVFITEMKDRMEESSTKILYLEEQILDNETTITDLKEQNAKLEQQYFELEKAVKADKSVYAGIIKQIEQRHTEDEMYLFRNLRLKLSKPAEENANIDVSGNKNTDKIHTSVYAGVDYFDFENHFRGSRAQIKSDEAFYIPYFENKHLVLDLGCGRGEFLELLKEHRIKGIGIDIYEEFVEYCRAKELDARCDDAVSFLMRMENDSIGGIFAAQLIEHLSNDQLLNLCHLAYEKLETGGCLVFETPNPICLSTYTNAFYIDPSHQKPVHPKTIEYFLKREGFHDVEILFTEESKSGYRLPLLSCESSSNLEEFNNGMNLLSDILFGSENYAVTAIK